MTTRRAPERLDLAGHASTRSLAAQLEHAVREVDGLRAAMRSRATIEQAKGILMCARGCDADAAFSFLVRISQASQTKLRDVAEALVRHVAIPGSSVDAFLMLDDEVLR